MRLAVCLLATLSICSRRGRLRRRRRLAARDAGPDPDIRGAGRPLARGADLPGRRDLRRGQRRRRPVDSATADAASQLGQKADLYEGMIEQIQDLGGRRGLRSSRRCSPPVKSWSRPSTTPSSPPSGATTSPWQAAEEDAAAALASFQTAASDYGFEECGQGPGAPSSTAPTDPSDVTPVTPAPTAPTPGGPGTDRPGAPSHPLHPQAPAAAPEPAAAAAERRAATAAAATPAAAASVPADARGGLPKRSRATPPRRRRAARRRRRRRSAPRGCPDSAIRPPSRTTILPARRIVERRWAITIAVRPASRRSRPCSITFSVRTSTFEVASSRIRIRGSASSARAKATSWRWPAESWTPALADLGLDPLRQRGDELRRADGRRRRLDLLQRSRRAARRRCSPAPCPRTGSPPGARSRAGARSARCCDPAQVVAVDQHPPPLRVVEARDQLREGRLAGARSPRPAPASAPAAHAGRRPAAPTRPPRRSASRSNASSA